MNRTYINNKKNQIQWCCIDAQNQTLGRLSTIIANNLKNKYSTDYTPFQTNKIYIIVINAADIKVSGNKKNNKIYYRHSGKPGSLRTETFSQLQQRIPTRIIERAVKGMLPKNALGRKLFTHLKVYAGSYHPHKAQKPILLKIK